MTRSSGHHTQSVKYCAIALFCLSAALQMLRGLRDSMAIEIGLDSLQYLMTGSFIVIAFLSIASLKVNLTDRAWLGWLIGILAIGILASAWWTYFEITYILIGGFSVILISQLWKTISLTNITNSKAIYTTIAIWGSLGAISGPIILLLTLSFMGIKGITLIAVVLLFSSLWNVSKVESGHLENVDQTEPTIKSNYNGLWIGLFVFIYALVSTFIYVKQLEIVQAYSTSTLTQTYLFGLRDLIIGLVLLVLQYLLSRSAHLEKNKSLMFMPILCLIGIMVISLIPTVTVLIATMVFLKSYNYALVRPSRELFYAKSPTILNYKNGIDGFLYRVGDLVAIWLIMTFDFTNQPYYLILIVLLPVIMVWHFSSRKIQLHLNTNS